MVEYIAQTGTCIDDLLDTPVTNEVNFDDTVGSFVHHTPTTSYSPPSSDSVLRFIEAYQNSFGEIPEIWEIKDQSCASCASGCGGGCSG